jgi:hypothetical protein
MKTIKNFLWQMLAEDGKVSSMRVGLISLVWMSSLLVGCLGFNIIYLTIKDSDKINWSGVALLLAAIGAFMSPIIYGKIKQKDAEK